MKHSFHIPNRIVKFVESARNIEKNMHQLEPDSKEVNTLEAMRKMLLSELGAHIEKQIP